MTSKFTRPAALAALVLTAGALSAGTATAAAPTAPATAVAGSVEVCIPIPGLPLEVAICL
ncbi:hypothetical protein IU449_18820 [Nocardia higoensis]|uniref:Uncharacterized protein n=1 Tax=Nocardia higoensis TaxID=228599 RepID=A0ABS0DDM0_9NOCA|nr:hypothetical protein [Nocardia higoensis]MBF6356572.1 hypothetical protein [Nocardia higoensis]